MVTKEEILKKLDDYLADCKIFYLTTVDGDRPKCRPLGFHLLEGSDLYFGVGTFKDVYKEMQENPMVEIVASKPDGFVRFYGRAVFEPDYAMADSIVAGNKFLQGIYNDETGYKMGVFHLEDATVEFRSMLKVEESFTY